MYTSSEGLVEAYKQARYPVGGHGKRTVQVLKDALAAVDGQTDSDMYGKGNVIEAFQTKMAAVLGKEAAVFFPSGTMAQQIALRIWSDRRGVQRVAYHPLSHLEIHEEDGLRLLHGLEPVLLGERSRLITLQDVQAMDTEVSCLLLELPQREIGGQLPEWAELVAIAAECRRRGLPLHLDGARLFEALPYYGKTAEEVCRLFDSVYVSFYKGLGGVAGAILAGTADFVKDSLPWKRRHGGDLISLYPYILSADYAYDLRSDRMGRYRAAAKELAAQFRARCGAVRLVPEAPVTNMFHVHLPVAKAAAEPLLARVYAETGVGFAARLKEEGASACSFEVSLGDAYELVPQDALQQALALLDEELRSAQQQG